ncbi:HU family DNA-binding protein [Candidatus Nitrosacidococcus tergens]|uniref:Integration host factor subunit beta n=1 Tax=Candidatus Nitrosacidococcus tergens TaxID=553981 RepID=A0A7G1QAD8_9GAMM|nr:HU family DNA-binding protein [Candidatus Nitrosacidococcus tergens]CAB1276607.1 Integration host factor subunit beta [Candidatus Nitrosacidococcus tergens]
MKKTILLLSLVILVSTSAHAIGEKELATRIAKQTEIEQNQVESIIAAFKDQIVTSLKEGEEVRLSSLGKFYAKHMDARKARNPRTGEQIQVPAKSYLRFKAFPSGSDQIN